VLRAHGAQVSLFFAAEKGMTDEIAARIAAGQDVNACNEEGRTALELALENDQEEAAAVLRAHGAQVSLFFAAEKGMTDEIAARIAAGQDVNARDQVIFLCLCACVGGFARAHTHTHTHTRIFFFVMYLHT
jgi:ankyrin repeat protein